jgi:hypothetical protein
MERARSIRPIADSSLANRAFRAKHRIFGVISGHFTLTRGILRL